MAKNMATVAMCGQAVLKKSRIFMDQSCELIASLVMRPMQISAA
jgi:hypothetical protein